MDFCFLCEVFCSSWEEDPGGKSCLPCLRVFPPGLLLLGATIADHSDIAWLRQEHQGHPILVVCTIPPYCERSVRGMIQLWNIQGVSWWGVQWQPRREDRAVGVREMRREQGGAEVSEWVMCNMQGSGRYKMILLNYLELPSIAWQVWTTRRGSALVWSTGGGEVGIIWH